MKRKQTGTGKTGRAFEKASAKASADRSRQHYVLRLFVAGMSPRSQDAIVNIRELCEKYIGGRYELEVIDIHQHPLSASENQILAAPTLIKMLPLPMRKFVGDMTKTDKSGPTGIAGSPPGPIGALLLPFLSGVLF